MTKLTMEEKQQLIRMALAAREKAYAPYSDFMVGAALRAADGRGPIVATADGECAPKEQITVQVQPLAGRILLPKPALERFAAQRTAQSADRT